MRLSQKTLAAHQSKRLSVKDINVVEDTKRQDLELLLRQRRYKSGDVLSPHDLSFQEMLKWKFNPKKAPKYDVFDMLGMDPRKEYKVATVFLRLIIA